MPMPDVSVMFEAKSTYYMHTTLYAFSTGGWWEGIRVGRRTGIEMWPVRVLLSTEDISMISKCTKTLTIGLIAALNNNNWMQKAVRRTVIFWWQINKTAESGGEDGEIFVAESYYTMTYFCLCRFSLQEFILASWD
jgi:hypothetical protein